LPLDNKTSQSVAEPRQVPYSCREHVPGAEQALQAG